MMQKKFFMKRLRYYLLLFTVPLLLVFLITFGITWKQQEHQLSTQAENTLTNTDTNLDLVISNVIFQNDQLMNNSHMLLALKKLLGTQPSISYGEAIYLRNIKTLMSSITRSYPYIKSVYLYLDEYDKFISSEDSVKSFSQDEDYEWRDCYEQMDEEEDTYVTLRTISENSKPAKVMTIFQRMLLLDGVVVMNIDINKYEMLLDNILIDNYETVLFTDQNGICLFAWNEEYGAAWENQDVSFLLEEAVQGTWIKIGKKQYLVHTVHNDTYNLNMISLISKDARMDGLLSTLRTFCLFGGIAFACMAFIAYETTKRTFHEISYLIQVFDDAEKGIYPKEPKKDLKDEYDVVMNNIIYLFLQTLKLNANLVEKQREQEVAELAALQLQINPHFLFNTLQNVQMQIRAIGPQTENTCEIIDCLSDILKYALSKPMEKITLREEITYLKKYVSIQQYRFGDQFIIYYEMEEEYLEAQVFRLMLQPLVENAIQHGIRNSGHKGYIKVKIVMKKDRLYFHVIDNGVGMSKQELAGIRESMCAINVQHIGLANVNNRLQLHYGEGAGLQILSRKGLGSAVSFWIPLEYKDEV